MGVLCVHHKAQQCTCCCTVEAGASVMWGVLCVHHEAQQCTCCCTVQAGASVMWGVLRDDSRLKLMRDDTNLSAELKVTHQHSSHTVVQPCMMADCILMTGYRLIMQFLFLFDYFQLVTFLIN